MPFALAQNLFVDFDDPLRDRRSGKLLYLFAPLSPYTTAQYVDEAVGKLAHVRFADVASLCSADDVTHVPHVGGDNR